MKTLKIIFLLVVAPLLLGSCNIKDKKTTLQIVDNNRHYYPILRAQKRTLRFSIKNTGEHPFILTDIFTSCGCLKVSKKSSIKAIPVNRKGFLILDYTAISNIGKADYYVTLYGNLDSVEKKEVKFDINIVPDASYTKDYEQIFKNLKDKHKVKQLVNGNENDKGYYVDKHASHSNNNTNN